MCHNAMNVEVIGKVGNWYVLTFSQFTNCCLLFIKCGQYSPAIGTKVRLTQCQFSIERNEEVNIACVFSTGWKIWFFSFWFFGY